MEARFINPANLPFKKREADTHKGTYGHALLVAGSIGRMGAAVIAARACLRAGAGLLTVSVPNDERFVLQSSIPEAMLLMRQDTQLDFAGFSALGIGPGLSTDLDSVQLLTHIISECEKPLLLDADALNIVAVHPDLLRQLPKKTVLTPHPKEFDRLFGPHQNDKQRRETAVMQAQKLGIVLVLKGHQTLITHEGTAFLNTTGNAGLAKGGSGDALTGIITAFLAQGYAPFAAAQMGVYLHGLAADLALETQSMESMLISDVIACLGAAFKVVMRE